MGAVGFRHSIFSSAICSFFRSPKVCRTISDFDVGASGSQLTPFFSTLAMISNVPSVLNVMLLLSMLPVSIMTATLVELPFELIENQSTVPRVPVMR